MPNISHFLLTNSIAVNIDGVNHSISKGDHRFESVKNAINAKDFASIPDIIDPTKALGIAKCEVRDGLIFYEDELMPGALGNKFIEHKVNNIPFTALLNLWLNKKRRGEELSVSLINCIADESTYPITEDGFYFVYFSQNHSVSRESISDSGAAKFYDISKVSESYSPYFAKKLNIKQIADEVFGFSDPKLIKILLKNLFTDNGFNASILDTGLIFKGFIAKENFYSIWDKNLINLTRTRTPSEIEDARYLLEVFSEKKILNLLEKAVEKDLFFSTGKVLRRLKIDISRLKFSSFDALSDFCIQEKIKLNSRNFLLKEEEHYPAIEGLNGAPIGNGMNLVIPKDNHTLVYWSQVMGNCIGRAQNGFPKKAARGETLLLGVSREGRILYNIEVKHAAIQQFERRGMSLCADTDRAVVEAFLTEKNVIGPGAKGGKKKTKNRKGVLVEVDPEALVADPNIIVDDNARF